MVLQGMTKQELITLVNELRQELVGLEGFGAKLRATEYSLKESRELLGVIVENISDSIFITDERGVFIYVSPHSHLMCGRSAEEITALQNVKKLLGEDLFDSVGVGQDGEIGEIEREITDKFGQKRTILVSVKRVSLKGGSFFFQCRDVSDRKRVEVALRASEAQLSNALIMAHLGHWEYDVVKDVFTFNDHFYRIFRTTGKQVGGYLMSSEEYARRFVHPEDMSVVGNEIRKSIETTDPNFSGQLEHRILYADGEIGHIIVRYFAVKDDLGRTIKTYGVNQDITERRRSEEALRESEERYRSLFENMLEGFAYCKMIFEDGKPQDFTYLDVNSAFARLTGLKSVVGKKVTEVIPGIRESNPELFEIYGRVALTGSPEKFEMYLDALGIWFSISVYSTEREHFISVFDTITKRKRAEQELKEAKHFLDRIINSIADPVLVKNEKHEWVLLNEAYCAFMGYAHEELIGKLDSDFFPRSEADVFWEKDEIVFRTGEENINEEKFTDRNGMTHTIVTKKSLYVDPSGKRYLVGIIRDTTDSERALAERRKLEYQLQQAQKMEAVGTLAGGIAHDFNNLLQVTLGYSELLLSEKSEKDPDHADLSKIYQAARSGAELVRSLLTFSRKVESKPIPMNLNVRISHVEQLLRRTIPRMIDIRLELADDLERLNADPAQIEQIIMNLALNARDSMPDGGVLTVGTRNVTLDEDYCRLHAGAKTGDHVLLSVSDTGQGMGAETLEHIFEPFYTTKELGRGTGLGLAMVYGVVKQHGGHIACYSEVGKGTRFEVYLPAIPVADEAASEFSGEMPAFGTETVLLVDDEDLVRELGERILTRSGYTVLKSADGGEALELYNRRKGQISLVILDLIMPAMGGKECLKELLKIDPQVKVLIASGYSADTTTRECAELGAKGFVAKPFRLKKLLSQVRKTLDQE